MIGMYPWGRDLPPEAVAFYRRVDAAAMAAATHVVFPTRWSADFARQHFDVPPEKVHVIPYGANLNTRRDAATIEGFLERRSPARCELLLVGTDWERKGGPLSADITRLLNERGIPARLTVLGCTPKLDPMPERDAAVLGRDRMPVKLELAHHQPIVHEDLHTAV